VWRSDPSRRAATTGWFKVESGVAIPPSKKECSEEEHAAKAELRAKFIASQVTLHGRQPSVEEQDVPQATEPVDPALSSVAPSESSPLPPHTVMIDGVLFPDPKRPWVGKRFKQFTVDDRRAIVAMYKHVEWETLTDDEGDVLMELSNGPAATNGLETTPSQQEFTTT